MELDPGEAYADADFGFKNGSFFEGHVFWDVNHNGVYEPMAGTPETGLAGIVGYSFLRMAKTPEERIEEGRELLGLDKTGTPPTE